MTNLEERKIQRFQFLNLVYDKTQGNTLQFVSMWDVGEELGWDRQTTEVAAQYLVGEGLIKFWAMGGTMGITHEGVKEIERARAAPDKPTTYFPAVINILSGDFRGSILNVESILTNLTQSIGTHPEIDSTIKDDLKRLVEQLKSTLRVVPSENAEEAETVAWAAESLLTSAMEKRPNKSRIEITKEGLEKAARNLASITPSVLYVAEQIVSTVNKFRHQ